MTQRRGAGQPSRRHRAGAARVRGVDSRPRLPCRPLANESRLRRDHRPAQRRQVHAPQPHRRREDRHRLGQAADHADADPRRRRTIPERRRWSFVDTPGIHRPLHRMNVRMVDAARRDAARSGRRDARASTRRRRPGTAIEFVSKLLKDVKIPVVLVLNKIDLVAKTRLLPVIERAAPVARVRRHRPGLGGDGRRRRGARTRAAREDARRASRSIRPTT